MNLKKILIYILLAIISYGYEKNNLNIDIKKYQESYKKFNSYINDYIKKNINTKKYLNKSIYNNRGIVKNYNISNSYNKNNMKNIIRTITWDGTSPIEIYVKYNVPVTVKFPAYIEKIEYIEGIGGIKITVKDMSQGTQSFIVTRTKNSKNDNICYVTILGKRIPILFKYSPTRTDYIVLINIPKNILGIKENTPVNNIPKKIISYKELTHQLNLRSVGMILHMIKGDAKDYYSKIDLNYDHQSNMFNADNLNKEKYIALLFKNIFNGNKYFLNSFFNDEIIPLELYRNDFMIYVTNEEKKICNIYGLKFKWCNLSHNVSKQITIDDIKLIIGRRLLAAEHPFRKIPPGYCGIVYVVFYNLKN